MWMPGNSVQGAPIRRAIQADQSLREQGIDARFVQLDVTDDASAERAAAWVSTEYERLDVLVNNAGIAGGEADTAPSRTIRQDMCLLFETNAFLPLLYAADAARIVNVSSEVGSITALGDPHGPLAPLINLAYAASKTALNMVTALYAKELHDTLIKVNAAIPGYTTTDLNAHTGFRTAAQAAAVSVALATLSDDGPTGAFLGSLTATPEGNSVSPW